MNRKILSIITLISLTIGCSDEIAVFENSNYLSINLTKNSNNISEYTYTFKFDDSDISEKEVMIPIVIAGRGYDENRFFSVKVVDSLTTALEGVHYKLSKDKNYIKANEYSGFIHINTIKTADMNSRSYTLGLEIESDNNFNYGDNRVVLYTFSDKLEKPTWWYIDKNCNIGYYTETKLALWYEFWNIMDGSDPWGVFPYWDKPYSWSAARYQSNPCKQSRELFKAWLTDHKKAPLYDENGDMIIHTLYRLVK